MGGLSNLTVDNTKSGFDTVVKVFDKQRRSEVRVFFLLAGERFTAAKLLPGDYDIQYIDLDSGIVSESETLTFTEIQEPDGVLYHNKTVTLYKVRNPEQSLRFDVVKIAPDQFLAAPQ